MGQSAYKLTTMIVDMYVLEEQDWSGNWGLSWNHLLVLKYQFSFPCPYIQGDFFHWYPLKSSKYRKGVSRPIYVNVDSPNLGFPYFNFLGGTSEKNHPVQLKGAIERRWGSSLSLVTRVKFTRVKDISVGGLNLINKLPPLPSPPYVFDTRNKVLSTYVELQDQ